MATLKTLAKRLDFDTEEDYFNYMISSHINGNFSQCRELFKAMSKADRKEFIQYINYTCNDQEIYNFYFSLI
jgi:hypothetical protein